MTADEAPDANSASTVDRRALANGEAPSSSGACDSDALSVPSDVNGDAMKMETGEPMELAALDDAASVGAPSDGTAAPAAVAAVKPASEDRPLAFTGLVGQAAYQEALAQTDAAKAAPQDAGVPRELMLRVLQGPERVVYGVWEHWRSKRQADREGVHMPLLSRLRQEAAEIAFRKARLSSAHGDMYRAREQLMRVRYLVGLIRRREKLKRQVRAQPSA